MKSLNAMMHGTVYAAVSRAFVYATMLVTMLMSAGCGCGIFSKEAWAVSDRCVRQWREEEAAEKQKTQPVLPKSQVQEKNK